MKLKIFLRLASAGAVAALFYLALRPRPVEVDLGTVTRGVLTVTVDEDGEARARDTYLISSPLAGRLLRVTLEPGDAIAAGQVLAVIDPGEPGLLDIRAEAEARARVQAAEAAHALAASQAEIAEAEAEQARRHHERDLGRFERENISAATLEDSEHALRVARGSLAAARSRLDIARFELEQAQAALTHSRSLAASPEAPQERRFEIHAPADGVVLRRFQESSVMVPAGEPILEIGDPRDLEARIDVLSQDAVRVRPGQRVVIAHWGGGAELPARVRRVEPSAFTKVSALGVDEQRVWVHADLEEPASPESGQDPLSRALGDGYRVEARIVVWEEDGVLKVPAGALFRDGAGWAVYRLAASGRAEKAPVEIGERSGEEAQVLAGLEEGAQVTLHPSDRVSEGARLAERPR